MVENIFRKKRFSDFFRNFLIFFRKIEIFENRSSEKSKMFRNFRDFQKNIFFEKFFSTEKKVFEKIDSEQTSTNDLVKLFLHTEPGFSRFGGV